MSALCREGWSCPRMQTWSYVCPRISSCPHMSELTLYRAYTHMCDMTHLHAWHDSFLNVGWLIQIRKYFGTDTIPCLYVWHYSFMCDMTHRDVWHDSFICVAWLIQISRCFWSDTRQSLYGSVSDVSIIARACGTIGPSFCVQGAVSTLIRTSARKLQGSTRQTLGFCHTACLFAKFSFITFRAGTHSEISLVSSNNTRHTRVFARNLIQDDIRASITSHGTCTSWWTHRSRHTLTVRYRDTAFWFCVGWTCSAAGIDENILICLHCEHCTLHLHSVRISVYREKTGYAAMEKEIVRPASLANKGV